MLRAAITLAASAVVAVVLFGATPASACEAHAKEKAAAKTTEPAAAKETDSVLKPVDEILSATCNCSGPSDCTCKKGECKCKKCQKHHEGVHKTQLLKPLAPVQPVMPVNARNDATAGVFI